MLVPERRGRIERDVRWGRLRRRDIVAWDLGRNGREEDGVDGVNDAVARRDVVGVLDLGVLHFHSRLRHLHGDVAPLERRVFAGHEVRTHDRAAHDVALEHVLEEANILGEEEHVEHTLRQCLEGRVGRDCARIILRYELWECDDTKTKKGAEKTVIFTRTEYGHQFLAGEDVLETRRGRRGE